MDNNLMKPTPEWMEKTYNYFNHKYFSGALPDSYEVKFKIDKSTQHWGLAHCDWQYNYWNDKVLYSNLCISMSTAWSFPEHIMENTLLHEMIHILDYSENPSHFAIYTEKGWKRVRYDAHGDIFFKPWANKLRQYGFDIYGTIQKEEESVSQLDPQIKQKIDKKKAEGCMLWLVRNSNNITYWFKSSNNLIRKILEHARETNSYYMSEYGKVAYEYIQIYHTNSPFLERYTNNTKDLRGFKKSPEELKEMIDKIKNSDSYIELYYEEDFAGDNKPVIGIDIDDDMSKDEIQPKVDEPEVHKIPLFRLKTKQGNNIEFSDITKEELIEKLKEKFPNWNDDILNRIISNKANYPMGENKVKFNKKDVNYMVNEVIKEYNEAIKKEPMIINGFNGIMKRKGDSISIDMA